MKEINYLMESNDESIRLDLKTDISIIEKQALWAGIKPGMRIADIGCGPGKITSNLYKLVSPEGSALGIDGSKTRLEYAGKHYGRQGVEFVCKNILEPIDGIGTFDFVWVRFVIEYYRNNAVELLRNVTNILKPDGILVLIDLDHNPLNNYGFSDRLDKTLSSIMNIFENEFNFDPYAGRKLYTYMYDLGFKDIDVNVSVNSTLFGQLGKIDYFNWIKKVEVIRNVINYDFQEYEGGYDEFIEEFHANINNPRRFSYNPLICCRGQKPLC